MTRIKKAYFLSYQQTFIIFASLILAAFFLVGCGPSAAELEAVNYAPQSSDEWEVSTPEEQGLDPMLVAEMYHNAAEMENIYSLLVFKNGYLVAEDYFNIGTAEQQVNIHSVTKSINSALVGLALEEGCLTSLDQKMMYFFPEFDKRIRDPRKRDITIRQMLQMRAGVSLGRGHGGGNRPVVQRLSYGRPC